MSNVGKYLIVNTGSAKVAFKIKRETSKSFITNDSFNQGVQDILKSFRDKCEIRWDYNNLLRLGDKPSSTLLRGLKIEDNIDDFKGMVY